MLSRAVEIMPLRPMPVQGLIQLDAAAGRSSEARAEIARLAALTLDDRLMAYVKGSAAVWLKDYDGATGLMPTMMADPAMVAATTRGFPGARVRRPRSPASPPPASWRR